jgi:hypothetical protein
LIVLDVFTSGFSLSVSAFPISVVGFGEGLISFDFSSIYIPVMMQQPWHLIDELVVT